MEQLCCLRCSRPLEAGQKWLTVYLFAQTVGIKPRQRSASQRICFCPQCSVSLAMGLPPDGALNMAAWKMIRHLVGSDAALNQAAWETLRKIVGLLPDHEVDAGSVTQPSEQTSAAPPLPARSETPPRSSELQSPKNPEANPVVPPIGEHSPSDNLRPRHLACSPLSLELERSQLSQCFYVALYCSTHGEYRVGVSEAPGDSHPCPVCNVPCKSILLGRGATRRPLPFWSQTKMPIAHVAAS